MFQRMGLMAPTDGNAPAGGGAASAAPATDGPQSVFAPMAKEESTETAASAEPATSPTPPAAAAATPAAAPSPVAMSDEQLTKLAQSIANGVKPVTPATQEQPNRPLTPEEQAQFDKEFNVVRVTPQLFQSIMGFAPESAEQLKAFENFAHGIVRQASAMTMFQVQQMAEQRQAALEGRLGPVLQQHAQAQAKAIETEFFTSHPDLKGFDGLLQEVAIAAKAQGMKFKSPQEAATYVANKARTLLGKSATSGTTQTSTQTGKTQSKPSMPTTSVGGRSGSSGSPQPASGPKAVFGDLDGSGR